MAATSSASLRCKISYTELCPINDIRLVGNSLVAWPASLRNCRRAPHPLREEKVFLRDQILCRESGAHIGNVQNNLALGEYKGKHVALFRASETVLDCGQGTIVDLPSWKALREMLGTKKPEVALTVNAILQIAGEAQEEVAEGLAEEVKTEPGIEAELAAKELQRALSGAPPTKKPRFLKDLSGPSATWLRTELAEYPNAIRLVTSTQSADYSKLIEEAAGASLVAYDVQWSPDFEEGTDNPIALVQLAFPTSGNTYVMQLALMGGFFPSRVLHLFESKAVTTVGFAANEIDVHKLNVSGVRVDVDTLVDVQPWCEAEMGENESVKQGWRVGLKRAASCVLDFDLDKTSTVASSNWEREELTLAQVEYAAMDVWAALRLYQRLAAVYAL
eukprot:TRINITY_DN25612_c0_g1_i1.p1 TRINITY_DN25612_c0_g1~~TRINITY_DN25612_c0_g1_i1.p1  ORF type:complete len:390 (-),score=95.94 TRINITY_DN25612_c0_g1_i1:41-1210(-)